MILGEERLLERIEYIDKRLDQMRKDYLHGSPGYRLFLIKAAGLLKQEKQTIENNLEKFQTAPLLQKIPS